MNSPVIISNPEDLQRLIQTAVKTAVKEQIPDLIREATAKEWLTKKDLQDLTGWSNRTIQYMRDTEQIPYSQHGYKILYPRKGIIKFLEEHHITTK